MSYAPNITGHPYSPDNPRHPDIEIDLLGLPSGASAIIGTVVQAITDAWRDGRLERDERTRSIKEFRAEAYGGDYDNLLYAVACWVVIA